MAKTWWRALLTGLSLLLFISAPGFSQSQATTGVISGTVVDPSDAVLPGASVAIRNTATNFEKTETTDSGGRFRAILLPLGPCRITVSLPGFATLVREGITLSVGQEVNLRLSLQLSGVEQEIRVTGEAPVVETSRTAGSTLIDSEAVQNLPNASHNFLDFTKLTPGVTIVQGPDGDELSINGQKGIHNNISVDGQDFNNPFFGEQRGGQRPPFTFNLDAVQEVVVVADGANAEFGRSSGGFVNVITKSGTNDFHGSAHVYYRDDSLSSKAAKPGGGKAEKFENDRWQEGFTLGGPLLQDRLFYFLGADAQQGNSTKQTDPTRIEQRVVDYFASIGIPDENGPIDRTDDAFVALVKLDWHATQQHLATLRYAYQWSEQENGTFDVDSWGVSANAIEKDFSYSIGGSVISTLSSTLLNELRGQYSREDRPRPYTGPDIAGQDRPLPDTAFDFVSTYRFGMPFFIPVEYYDNRTQILDNVSIVLGDHSIKLGFEWNRVVSKQTFIGFANGRWIFSSTDGFLRYALNPRYVECSDGLDLPQRETCPAGTTITGPVLYFNQQTGVEPRSVEDAGTQSIAQEEPAAFIQDTWQPMRNLTINAGLRWEALLQPDPRTPPEEVFFAPFIGQTSMGQEFPSDGTIPSDKKMWQPRLGIAWDPWADGKTVARATFGIFYARIPALNTASSRSTNGSIGRGNFRNSSLTSILGPVPAYPNLLPASDLAGPTFFPDVYVFDKDFQNPRTTAWSVGVDREIVPGWGATLKYNYAKTDHITRFVNTNDPRLGCPWGTGLEPGGTNGINCGDGILPTGLLTVESTAKSKYWGVTLGVNKQLSNRYAFQAYYTYSKDKSDDDNERDPFSLRYAKVTDLEAEYSWSDRDQRHRFNSWFLWQAPWDINVNARYSFRSAQPKSIKADGTDAAIPSDRINPDGTVTRRNLGRKDNKYSSLDLRLSKEFTIAFLTIEPIIEAFNLFNSDNFLSPEVTNLIFNFDGTIRSGNGDPRQVQLGLRVIW